MVGNPRTSYCWASCTFCFFSSVGWDFLRGKSSSTRTRLSCAKFLNSCCEKMSLSSLMHHPHQSDPVKLRNRSLWFVLASSCALFQSCCQSDSARAKAAKTNETAAAKRNNRGVFTPPYSMQLQPSARAIQRIAPGQLLSFKPAKARRSNAGLLEEILIYFRCFETSLVISNMLTWLLPLNTGLSASSALIMILCFLSCRPRLLMYAQSFFVSSGRDSGVEPTTAASLSSG